MGFLKQTMMSFVQNTNCGKVLYLHAKFKLQKSTAYDVIATLSVSNFGHRIRTLNRYFTPKFGQRNSKSAKVLYPLAKFQGKNLTGNRVSEMSPVLNGFQILVRSFIHMPSLKAKFLREIGLLNIDYMLLLWHHQYHIWVIDIESW